MSYRSLLRHRCKIQDLRETFVQGMPVHAWVDVKINVRCFVDLNFVRMGKDPTWSPEAGRPTMRTGVGFFLPNEPLLPGNRIVMIKGPKGTFKVGGAVDEAWRPTENHHLEVSLEEVPAQIHKGEATVADVPAPAPAEPTIQEDAYGAFGRMTGY